MKPNIISFSQRLILFISIIFLAIITTACSSANEHSALTSSINTSRPINHISTPMPVNHATTTLASSSNTPLPIPPENNPISEKSYPSAAWDIKPDGRKWTKITHTAISELGKNLLTSVPKDIKDYCSAYDHLSNENRKDFWVYLISSLARFESNYNPNEKYVENFRDRNGNFVISRGLLQISKESANGYGCKIEDENELHDPEVNIRCGIRIINHWVSKDGVIAAQTSNEGWRGAARYWSPFRNQSKRTTIASETSSQSYCQ